MLRPRPRALPASPAALVVAVAAHVAALSAIPRVRPRAPTDGTNRERAIASLAIEVAEPEPPAPGAPRFSPDEPLDAPRARPPRTSSVAQVPATEDARAPASEAPPAMDPGAARDEGAAWSLPSAPADLGLGLRTSGMASRATALAGGDPARSEPPPASVDVRRLLTDPLRERDAALGLRSSGPLVAVVKEAVHASFTIEPSEATLDVDVDGGGLVLATRVLTSTRVPAAWEAIAHDVTALMARRRLRTPPGGGGMQTRLHVVVTPTRADRPSTAAGAVPDDAPGGDKVCDGTGLTRRCVAGLPLGMSVTGGGIASTARALLHDVKVEILAERAGP